MALAEFFLPSLSPWIPSRRRSLEHTWDMFQYRDICFEILIARSSPVECYDASGNWSLCLHKSP